MRGLKGRQISFGNALFILAFCFSFLFMVTNAAILFDSLSNYIGQEIVQNHISNLESGASRFEQNLRQAVQAVSMLSQNNEFINYLLLSKSSAQAQRSMWNMVSRYTSTNSNVDFIIVVTKNGEIYSNGNSPSITYEDIETSDYFASIRNASSPVLYSPTAMPLSGEFLLLEHSFFGMPIIRNGETIAYILLVLSDTLDGTTLEGLWTAIRYNDSGIIHAHEKLQEYIDKLKEMKAGKTKVNHLFFYAVDLFDGHITLILADNQTFLSGKTSIMVLTFFGIFLFTILASYLLARFLARKLVRPLEYLRDKLNTYLTGKDKFSAVNFQFRKKYLTFRETILFYFVTAVFVPLLVFDVLYIPLLRNTTEHYLSERALTSFMQTSDSINAFFTNRLNCLRSLTTDLRVQDILYDLQYLTPNQPSLEKELYNILTDYQVLFSTNDVIYIYDRNGGLLYSTSQSPPLITHAARVAFIQYSWDNSAWIMGQKNQFKQDVFSGLLKILNLNSSGELGAIQCVTLESELRSCFKNQNSQYLDYFLVDKNNIIISSTKAQQIGLTAPVYEADPGILFRDNEANQLVITGFLPESELQLRLCYRLDSLSQHFNSVLFQQIIILILFFLLSIALGYYFSIRLTQPLQNFYQLTEGIGTEYDEISSLLPVFPENSNIIEINQLGHSFNKMVERVELLLDEVVTYSMKQGELELKRKNAEIFALQSQINSHFIYNTFENINGCIAMGQSKQAMKMIDSLSSLLRYSSKSAELLVSIEQELNHLEQYIYLIGIRFGEKIRYVNEIDPKYHNCTIVRLTLQPIVENAINHGLLPKKDGGIIRLSARETENTLEILISDNGVGMTTEQVRELNERLKSEQIFERVGLFNVNNRLIIALGNQYCLNIESKQGYGTTVTVRLPKSIYKERKLFQNT